MFFARLALVAAAVLAQAGAPPQSAQQAPKSKDVLVHVRGCIDGTMLKVTDAQDFQFASNDVSLTGGRAMMRSLKEHNGHEDEITGVLKARGPDDLVGIKEKRSADGKTHVWVGASGHQDRGSAVAPMDTLDVRGVKHLGPRCRS